MFALFYSLYLAMFTGRWRAITLENMNSILKPIANAIGEFITSIFGDNVSFSTLGDILFSGTNLDTTIPNSLALVAFILALITSIGIVVMAVKGIKKVFGIFFYGVK